MKFFFNIFFRAYNLIRMKRKLFDVVFYVSFFALSNLTQSFSTTPKSLWNLKKFFYLFLYQTFSVYLNFSGIKGKGPCQHCEITSIYCTGRSDLFAHVCIQSMKLFLRLSLHALAFVMHAFIPFGGG